MKTLIVLSALCAVAFALPSHRIVYGDPIDISEAPFQLQFEVSSGLGFRFTCGATIIGPNYFLTAGHCVNPSRPGNYRVRAGSTKRGSGTIYDVQEIIRHPQYYENDTYGTADYDIAFVTITDTFEFNDNVQPIDFTREEPAVNENARVTGWGLTENGGLPDNLLQANGTIIDRQKCEQSFTDAGIIKIPETMICLGAPQHGEHWTTPCNGDSGGPLVVNNVQVGVVSWGGSCDVEKGTATVFTNVAHFSDWVDEQIQNVKKAIKK